MAGRPGPRAVAPPTKDVTVLQVSAGAAEVVNAHGQPCAPALAFPGRSARVALDRAQILVGIIDRRILRLHAIANLEELRAVGALVEGGTERCVGRDTVLVFRVVATRART